ncbi:MAG: hypothetical protein MJ252_22320, partial [archaeon]|nr:hypothetical protein [archaeon]
MSSNNGFNNFIRRKQKNPQNSNKFSFTHKNFNTSTKNSRGYTEDDIGDNNMGMADSNNDEDNMRIKTAGFSFKVSNTSTNFNKISESINQSKDKDGNFRYTFKKDNLEDDKSDIPSIFSDNKHSFIEEENKKDNIIKSGVSNLKAVKNSNVNSKSIRKSKNDSDCGSISEISIECNIEEKKDEIKQSQNYFDNDNKINQSVNNFVIKRKKKNTNTNSSNMNNTNSIPAPFKSHESKINNTEQSIKQSKEKEKEKENFNLNKNIISFGNINQSS